METKSVEGAQLDAEVFDEMGPEALASGFALRAVGLGASLVRSRSGLRLRGLCGAEVVGGAEDELHAAGAGGDADPVEEDDGFVDVDGVGLSCAEEGDAARM